MNEPSYMGRRQLEEYRRAVGMYDGSKVSQPWLDTKSPCVLLLLVFFAAAACGSRLRNKL